MTLRISFCLLFAVLLLSCGNGITQTAVTAPARQASFTCSSPQKITAIYKDFVYDLSGYEGVSGGTAFNLFDENAKVDPKGKNEYHPSTSPHPVMTNSFYYPKNRGNRIVVDLKVPYRLSEIYLYDMSRQTDSIWIYTGTMQQWKLKAALSTRGDISQMGWRRIGIDDSTRYMMIRLNSWESQVTEAVLYGCAYQTPPPPPAAEYAGPRLPAKTLREFIGINTYQGVPLQYMKPFFTTRMYTPADFIDRDTINEYPKQQFNASAQGWWNGAAQDYTFFADSIAWHTKGHLWYSVLGVPYWMKKKGLDDHDRPVSKIGMNTEDPMSYGRHASMFWHLAALFGNTKVDTNLLQVYNSPRFSGRGVMTTFENGNEVDANWVGDKYCNPVEYFAMSSADYDGHEGKLGKTAGLKNADPSSQLVMAGMAGLDTNRLRILSFLTHTLRNDGKFIWDGGVQYHCYSVDGKPRFPGEAFAYATRALSPEEDKLRDRLTKVRNYTYKYAPGVPVILGEYGFDKSRKSKVATPIVKGYDSRQSQGIMLLRGINAVSFSGFDRLNIYWIKDDHEEGTHEYDLFFLSCGVIRHKGVNQYEPYASWYYINTLINNLGDYVPEKIISESGNVWIYKYRNKQSPDSAAYFVYCPTYNGTKVDNYSLAVGKVAGGTVTEISLAEQSETGNRKTIPVSGSVVKMNVTEAPKFLIVKER